MSKLPNIALMMIVKNEAKTLPRLVESVRPIISSWRIIDTGSTDGTQELVSNLLADLPGALVCEPWVNFGVNRTSLVSEFPDGAEFGLLMDADQILQVESITGLAVELSDHPEVDAFRVEVREEKLSYHMPYLVRNGRNYFYVGATHEYLSASHPLMRTNLSSVWIRHVGDGGSKSDKFTRDVALLSEAIAGGDDTTRNHFYLGQSYECLNRRKEAARHYQLVSQRSDWAEEKYISRLRLGRLALADKQMSDAARFFMMAIDACPDRFEARYELAKLYAAEKNHAAALAILRDRAQFETVDRILFIEPWLKEWGYDTELGVHLWHLGDVAAAATLFKEILQRPGLPPDGKRLVEANLSYC